MEYGYDYFLIYYYLLCELEHVLTVVMTTGGAGAKADDRGLLGSGCGGATHRLLRRGATGRARTHLGDSP